MTHGYSLRVLGYPVGWVLIFRMPMDIHWVPSGLKSGYCGGKGGQKDQILALYRLVDYVILYK